MATYQTRSDSKNKYLVGLIVLILSAMASVAFNLNNDKDFELARQQILLRKIGHELLLHSGDSTSRVLPVQRIATNEYQIRFENEFSFKPDSLVKIVKSALAKDQLATDYIVNVRNCSGFGVIFGYVISGNEKSDIVPCTSRIQPKGCYLIEIEFQKIGMTTSQKSYLIGGIPLLAFLGLLFVRSRGVNQKIKTGNEVGQLEIGNTLFNVEDRKLVFTGNTIDLTLKETKLLLILASSPNVIIERSRLQKEIWEDEGVIVGRSLDMFISKLRKKLEGDISIQLKNIHSKGYKLVINSSTN
ncbi:transcriptional regulator [Pedobacter polaris]|uniref:Transcriptional regulator n=1 Tax=Pedobacter polaris TaxID=2571273 RepID=A0A4U1CQK7_9SPHI|nr:winged helix-turn-helix domain-containing protein [Pedobacter polaris]TKC09954.1 transcriptional regulator [Pedobacter polaris]